MGGDLILGGLKSFFTKKEMGSLKIFNNLGG